MVVMGVLLAWLGLQGWVTFSRGGSGAGTKGMAVTRIGRRLPRTSA